MSDGTRHPRGLAGFPPTGWRQPAIAGLAAAVQLAATAAEDGPPEWKQLAGRVGQAAAALVGEGIQGLANWIHARTESLRPAGSRVEEPARQEPGEQESGEQQTGARQTAGAERGTSGPGERQADGERSDEAEPPRAPRPDRRTRVTGRPTHPAAARRRRGKP